MPRDSARSIDLLADVSGVSLGLGVYDGLSALVSDAFDIDFLWLSSFCVSASLGRPDAGVLDASEMATLVRSVCSVTRRPVVVDMDSGYGDSLKVTLSAEMISRSGAAAVCIEDNPLVKRSSLYAVDDRVLATADEHVERLEAARKGLGDGCLLIARTEALVAGLGIDSALQRAGSYADAGADAVFVQATKPDGGQELLDFARKWGRRTPLFIAPTRYPELGADDYASAGVSHWIFANQTLRAAYRAVRSTVAQVATAKSGPAPALDPSIATVAEISAALGATAVGS